MIILDTDVVSLIQRRDTPTRELLLAKIDRELAMHPVVTTVITFEEQVRGWFKLLADAKTLAKEIDVYSRLSHLLDDYRRLRTLNFDDAAAAELQRLRKMKLRTGTMDLKIAACALSRDAILWSRNLLDFQRIPGLKVLDPLAQMQ